MGGKAVSLSILAACSVAAMALWFSATAVVPSLRAAYALSPGHAALLTSSVQIGFVAGTLISAILGLADRLDPRRFFMISALIATAANGAILLFVPTAPVVIGLRFVTGVCMAGIYPVGMKIVTTWAEHDMGLIVGVLIGALALGSASPHLLNALGGVDWRFAIAAASAASLAAALAICLVSLTGIPPTAGFVAKLYIFNAAVQSDLVWLVIVGVLILGVRRLSAQTWTPILTAALLVGMLWLWPYQEVRLTMPLIPVLGMVMVAAFRPEAERLTRGILVDGARPDPGTFLIGIMGLAWIVALGSASVIGLAGGRHVEPLRVREVMLARAVLAVEERVPPNGVVGAHELWAGLALHSGRRVAPSARFQLTGNGPVWGTPPEQFAVWSAAGIEYVVLENAGLIHREALDELEAGCPGAVQVQATWGGGLLVRLDWDDVCRDLVLPEASPAAVPAAAPGP